MKCILDSSAWLAFLIQDDVQHDKAVELFDLGLELMAPYSVLEELYAIINARQSKAVAIRSLSLLEQECNQILFPSLADHQKIMKLYAKLPNKIDYVDTSVIWYGQKLDLPVFTFDKHIKKLANRIVG